MMLYALGSIVFIIAMGAALAVMTASFAQYRHAMIAALRGLSLDGLDSAPAPQAGRFSLRSTTPLRTAATGTGRPRAAA